MSNMEPAVRVIDVVNELDDKLAQSLSKQTVWLRMKDMQYRYRT